MGQIHYHRLRYLHYDSVLIADLIRYGNFDETSLSDEEMLSLRKMFLIKLLLKVLPKTRLLRFQSWPQIPITTVPGIGDINAAIILGEIGDVSRFINASKLAAYAGIDASVSKSGDFQSSNNRMSKRGSPYLRISEKPCFKLLWLPLFMTLFSLLFIRKSEARANIIWPPLTPLPESFAIPFLLSLKTTRLTYLKLNSFLSNYIPQTWVFLRSFCLAYFFIPYS